ncbi:uncharacterized protein LOC124630949 [Helicoverpa zea]|uniref:uncharacterized protein LOC124630949 n=1 Tax=Helicoverpa zea TaxID=7113 RepID=UPI001F562A84|nr:uncharacterized protein LOC124630949 [Helicoverpa zea]
MGKRKRSDDSSVEKLLKKVKKLVKKKKRRISSSSSESSLSGNEPEITDDIPIPDELNLVASSPEGPEEVSTEVALDPEVLNLLGSDPSSTKVYGDNLHKDLATRWRHTLIYGLAKEEKADMLQIYLPPENCQQMKAPILNPEIKSAISEVNVKKDIYSESKQNQMASCIAAIGKALSLTLPLTGQVPQELIKTLSDAGRLLCDTHYRESLSRRFAIVNVLSKQKRDILKNTKIDNYLFGTDLSEQLKSSKAINQSASELKLSTNKPFNQQRTQQFHRQGPLNARGAPRAPATEQRVHPQPRRPPPAPPAQREQRRGTATRPRASNYSHPRRR